MVSINIKGRPLSASSPHHTLSGRSSTGESKFRIFGRRRLTKLRFRLIIATYLAIGCIIPYYVMKQAEEEALIQQRLADFDINNPQGYKRKAFFQDLFEDTAVDQDSSPTFDNPAGLQPNYDTLLPPQQPAIPAIGEDSVMKTAQNISEQHLETLDAFGFAYTKLRRVSRYSKIRSEQEYQEKVHEAVDAAHEFVLLRLPEESQFMGTRIPGTKLDNPEKARRFRQLMDEALNQGQWLYEPQRDYPDFGGATGWNKKRQNERDRDLTIDRQPFPEAGKYRWVPATDNPTDPTLSQSAAPGGTSAKGWQASRIEPEDFCRILGPRHIILVGDYVHWQLHDSILYNMFDNPQACYGDLACYHNIGHPLCPLPNDVRLKFVRNDQLSTIRPRNSRNETKSQNPVEMPWLRNMKLKDTIILGATHLTLRDRLFQRYLTDTVIKIRRARPDALIIYRNNPVGHPECPSKENAFNIDRASRFPPRKMWYQCNDVNGTRIPCKPHWTGVSKKPRIPHNGTTFAAEPKPFTQDIPVAELLAYPLDWVHYDRQNQIAKTIIEATGGIYWNVATMTNMRPDGHIGGGDCLSYKRPGPTDEWAVSLYNLFLTIDLVERENP
ncbi:hypothetical protein BGZ75_010098 [Mortierella antarctica]|nr:hypothetical protein BGZ75_010098 [Mortierella antarctica]